MKRFGLSVECLVLIVCITCGLCVPARAGDEIAQKKNDPKPAGDEAIPSQQKKRSKSAAGSQENGTAEDPLNSSIVMIKCQVGEEESIGAGIIFGTTDGRLYVATANHVVRKGTTKAQNVRVQFKWLPGEWKLAELLDYANSKLDLALLAIDLRTQGIQTNVLHWDQVGDPGSLKPGDSVFSVGYPHGEPWRTYVSGDKFFESSGAFIRFESILIGPGNSGGVLVNDYREIVGMIIDFEPPDGRALNIQSILDALKENGYSVNLSRKERRNDIGNFSVLQVSDTDFLVKVDYTYTGDHGTDGIILAAHPLQPDGLISGDFDCPPILVNSGRGTATLTIKRKPGTATFAISTIRVTMNAERDRQGIIFRDFPYR